MADLTNFERGMIVGARLAGASVTESIILVGVATSIVSTVMTVYIKQEKTSSAKHSSGRKSKLTDRDRRILKRIMATKHKTTVSQITSEMNT